MAAPAERPAGADRTSRHAAGFWIVAVTFLVAMSFSTIPTPLYPIYQARDGFPAFMITVIFAAYAVGVVLSLYLVGGASDWLGRKKLMLAALATEIVAAVIFLLWPAVPGLLIARVITGLGVGALTATATAYLGELRVISHPAETGRTASAVSTLVNIGGIGVGPLVAGALAQWVPSPLIVPYVVLAIALAVVALALIAVPETVHLPEVRPAYHPQRFLLPRAARGTFWSASLAAFAAFSVLGLFTSLAPTFLAGTLHETSKFVAGITTFGVFTAAAVSQLLVVRLPMHRQLRLAAALMAVGLTVMTVAVLVETLPLFIAAGLVAGAGVGVQFRAAIAIAGSLAEPVRRGEVLALTFLIAYIGLAFPVLLVGAALTVVPTATAFVGFAIFVGVVGVWTGLALSRRRV